MTDNLVKSPRGRAKRTPITTRSRLHVKNKDANYEYRIVNDHDDRIELFNKKAPYVYIREMTDATTQQITKVVKQMKDGYKKMFSDYIQIGYIPKDKTYEL